MVIKSKPQLSLAIEVMEPLPDEIYQADPVFEQFPCNLPDAVKYCKVSILRDPDMSLNELRNRLIFIDTECAQDINNQPILLSIAALDYDGCVLMNEIVCPRQYVNQYGSRIHVMTEKDLLDQKDSLDVLIQIRQMLRGRIIVGHDLCMEHLALDIKLDEIAGVRDLQGSFAVSNFMKDGKNSWNLNEVSRKLGVGSQHSQHSAMGDACLIQKIYRKLEFSWKDCDDREINTLSNRKNKEKIPPPRKRLLYITNLQGEVSIEKITQGSDDRQVIVTEPAVDMDTPPDVSIQDIDDENWHTPPSSLTIHTPIIGEGLPAQTPKYSVDLDISLTDGKINSLKEVRVTKRNITWIISGTNLNITSVPKKSKQSQ